MRLEHDGYYQMFIQKNISSWTTTGLKGVSSKPSGNHIVAPNFCLLS